MGILWYDSFVRIKARAIDYWEDYKRGLYIARKLQLFLSPLIFLIWKLKRDLSDIKLLFIGGVFRNE